MEKKLTVVVPRIYTYDIVVAVISNVTTSLLLYKVFVVRRSRYKLP